MRRIAFSDEPLGKGRWVCHAEHIHPTRMLKVPIAHPSLSRFVMCLLAHRHEMFEALIRFRVITSDSEGGPARWFWGRPRVSA